MRSRVETRILDAAIQLFAERGYSAGARDIAAKADSTTMTLYRAFHGRKHNLFEEAVREVIARSFDPGKLLLLTYEGPQSQDFSATLLSALLHWYAAMPPSSARLLAYAYLSRNKKWRDMAHSALEKIIGILATAIERQMPRKHEEKFDSRTPAKALVMVLFQMKTCADMRSPRPDKEEMKKVEMLLRYCLHGLTTTLKE
jgi:AcrR family transcriptional regulator